MRFSIIVPIYNVEKMQTGKGHIIKRGKRKHGGILRYCKKTDEGTVQEV